MTSGHAPTGMIADYAAGALSDGMSLLVASHLTFCPCCRDKAARLEALGGALLTEGEAAAPEPRCLDRALAAIAAPAQAPPPVEPRDPPLPRPLCRRLPRSSDLRWQPLAPGLATCRLDGFPAERVALMRAEPGVRMAPHRHAGLEGTLVLAGRMRDGALTWGPGDLAFADQGVEHAPEAVGADACLCLLVETGVPPA